MSGTPFRLAVAQSDISTDVRANGEHIRSLMREAMTQGCRLIHFPEGALSGYAKAQIKRWDDVNWTVVDEELEKTAALAASLGIWAVLGCNHRTPDPARPHNSLYVISDKGEIAGRYDKRLCSNSEINDWYAPGTDAVTFDIDGMKFGCVLCIEVHFPELFKDYEERGIDCVLLSSYSEEQIYGVMSRAHAAVNCIWLSLSVPAACAHAQPSGIIGPDGNIMVECGPAASIAVAALDKSAPHFDIALNKARPWRRKARQGEIYAKWK